MIQALIEMNKLARRGVRNIRKYRGERTSRPPTVRQVYIRATIRPLTLSLRRNSVNFESPAKGVHIDQMRFEIESFSNFLCNVFDGGPGTNGCPTF